MSVTILENSSQPYLYSYHNNNQLLYCYADSLVNLVFGTEYSIRPWKIKSKNLITNEDFEIDTPKSHPEHGNVILECNPHIAIINNIPNICYVAGFNKGDNQPIHYFLCSLPFVDLTFKNPIMSEFNIIKKTFTGYVVSNNCVIYNDSNKFSGKLIKENLGSSEQIIIDLSSLEFINILRISKIYNQDYFLVTGQKVNTSFMSVLLDNNFNFIKEIRNENNENVYKCTLLNNKLIYTVRHDSSEIEVRSLVEESYTI